MLKIIHLLYLSEEQYSQLLSTEIDIIPFLLTKLFLKHISILKISYILSPEDNKENLPSTHYDEYTKSFSVLVFLGEASNSILIPSSNDIY